jgi:hypothetical protein
MRASKYRARLGVLLCGLLAAATLAAGLLPVIAGAAIVPGRGIAGVRIGYSEARVQSVLGRPGRVVPPSWAYGRPLRGQVSFNHARRVDDIWTVSRAERTKRGVGPGSSYARMRQAYPKGRCAGHGTGLRICVLVSNRHKRTVRTEFIFGRRLLKRVEIYLVPIASGTPIPK